MSHDHFRIEGRDIEVTPYHYKECGLDTIYLANGFSIENLDGEDYVSIENIDGLWKAIGFSLVTMARLLQPKEIRFLRHQADLTQSELARRLRVDAQTVARWEKGQTEIPGPADLLLRLLVLSASVMQPEGIKILSGFAEYIDRVTDADIEGVVSSTFARQGETWQPAEAA